MRSAIVDSRIGPFVNLFTNPSFEATSGTVVVRTNLASDPAATKNGLVANQIGWGADWFGTGATGTNASVVEVNDGPIPQLTSYQRKTWTSANVGEGNVGWSHAPLDSTQGYPVVAGQTVTVSSYLRPSSGGHNARIQFSWCDSTGTVIGSNAYGTTIVMAAGAWSRIATTVTAPTGTAYLGFRSDVIYGPWAPGDTLDGTGLLVELSPVVGSYFDGTFSPDSDMTAAWSGAANQSPSTLSGTGATDESGSAAAAIQSGQWATDSTHSLRIIPTGSSVDTYAYIPTSMLKPGVTYTVTAYCRLTAPLTNTGGIARQFRVYYQQLNGTMQWSDSQQASNVAGVTQLSVTFTVPTDPSYLEVRLYNGGTAGAGDVWFDDLTVVQGVYSGLPFTGRTLRCVWLGAPDASQSAGYPAFT